MTMEHTEAVAIRLRQLHGKPVDPQDLAEALHVIQCTRTHTKFSRTKGTREGRQEAAARVLAKPKPAALPPSNPWGLTEAQCAVLQKYSEGQTQQEIASESGLARKTVNTHIERCREKMNAVTSTRAAVLWDRFARGQTV